MEIIAPISPEDGTIAPLASSPEVQEKLRQTEDRYRSLASATTQLVWTATPDGKVSGELPGWQKFTGQSLEEIQHDGWSKALHAEDEDHVVKAWAEAVRNQTDYNTGYRLRRHDGVYRDFVVHGVPVRREDGGVHEWVGCCMDITEQKRADESLKLFRALIDQSSDAIEVIDPQTGRLIDVNETAGQRLGYSREEMLSMSIPDLEVAAVTPASLVNHLEEIKKVGFKLVLGRHRRKDGSTFPIEVSVKYIHLDRDYLVAVIRDITERTLAEEKIASQLHELQFWRESTLGREDRLGCLKQEVNEALQRAGEPVRYSDPKAEEKKLPIGPQAEEGEQERLRTLRGYHVLDSSAEKDFDDIVALAAEICGTPIALVSLVDENRQWFKASFGLAVTETSREVSFCAHAINQLDLLVVPDARLDNRFANNPLVTGDMGIRFYAGSPLVAPDGKVLGTLCVIDSKPRQITVAQAKWLSVLSRHVMALLDLREQGRETARSNQALLSILEDERQARAAIRESEEQIAEQASFLDKAQDAIVVRDLTGKILFWNKGAERMYGWPRSEVLGRNMHGAIYGDSRKFEEINDLILSKGEWQGELQHFTKDRLEIIVEAHFTLIRDQKGQPKSVLAINTDITEKKKIGTHFLRAQRMESIGTLAGGFAHDLNNILSPIMLSIEVLQKTSDNPQTESILQTIAASAQRGAEIVRQVLSFTEGVEGERIEIDSRDLLKDLERITRDTFPKDIRLKFSVAKETWKILGDPTQMHQVLLNLCLNARDAMPNGGTLTLEAENCVLEEQYAVMNIQAKAGRYVKFAVVDSGRGMPPEVIEKIFEPFFTTKDLDDGTGLGLSTVMAIVKSHGGSISVTSEPRKGTTFNVYLPAMEALSKGRKEQAETSPSLQGNGETILVVDDEASILTITSQTLQSSGYQVLTATDGADAVSVYAEHQDKIAVVLTDMMMPVMDGPTMIHALLEINPSVKIIAVSGFNKNVKAPRPEVKYFLNKPCTSATLLKTLRMTLEEA